MKQNDQDFIQPYIYQQQEEKPTFLLIFKKKVFTWLEKNRFSKFVLNVLLFLLALSLAMLLIFPKYAAFATIATLSFYGGAIPKTVFAFYIVFNWKILKKKMKRKHNQHTIEGIPRSELLHFIFERNAFKLEEFIDRFGLSRKVHGRIAERLEKMGILKRGANNARVLSEKYSLEEINDIFSRANNAKSLSFWRVNVGGEDSLKKPHEKRKEIKQMIIDEKKMMEAPPDNPFTKRRLAS